MPTTWIALCHTFLEMLVLHRQFTGVSQKRAIRYFALIVLAIALHPLPADAQTPDPQPPGPPPDPARPPLDPFPAEQNWSFLAGPSKRTDFFDPVKYMFSTGPQDHDGYVMKRVMPHFDCYAERG